MKKIIASVFIAGFIVACSPKTAPTGTSAALPALENVSTESTDVAAGQVIFTTKCTKCHKAKDEYVANHTYTEATGVLNAMSKKAKLSQDEMNQLAAYVNSAAKK